MRPKSFVAGTAYRFQMPRRRETPMIVSDVMHIHGLRGEASLAPMAIARENKCPKLFPFWADAQPLAIIITALECLLDAILLGAERAAPLRIVEQLIAFPLRVIRARKGLGG